MSAVEAIPDEEMGQFRQFMQVFTQGEVILVEGTTVDDSLFLLREGTVGVFRQIGNDNKIVSTIDAINFFGEMALLLNEPRSASIVAISDEVIVYKLHKDDLKAILSNPTWSELLITRLVNDLKTADDRIIDTEEASLRLNQKYDQLIYGIALILSALKDLIQKLSRANIPRGKQWPYFNSFINVCTNYFIQKEPVVSNQMALLEQNGLNTLESQNYLPEILKTIH